MTAPEGPDPIFLDLATESENPAVTEIESLCLNCHEQGTTKLLLTAIPHFREVMVSSFSCPHCHFSDSGLLSTGDWQEKGVKICLTVLNSQDLKRMLVKSDFASIKIPEVELEVPGRGDKGDITNVEGVINKVVEGLSFNQSSRSEEQPELAQQIQDYIDKLKGLLTLSSPFTVEINDPTGNSYIERLTTTLDSQLSIVDYDRPPQLEETMKTAQQQNKETPLEQLTEEEEPHEEEEVEELSRLSIKEENKEGEEEEDHKEEEEEEINIHGEVMRFDTLCDNCQKPANTNMKVTDIPHFKEVVIMATVCDHCGHKTSEVKSGGGISEKGRRIALSIGTDHAFDMARDVLKSETCSVEIPELEIHMGAFVIVGKFTTVEGLLISLKDDLAANPFIVGDSVDAVTKESTNRLLDGIGKIITGDLEATLVLDDPAGNSYIQNIYAPDPDPGLDIKDYERTHEQKEDLGLNDMITEGYEQNEEKAS